MKLQVLELFKNRQVIVNTYIEDELINKDGFLFEKIEIIDERINFVQNQQTKYSISTTKYPIFHALDNFKNFFAFSNESNEKIEIYFP